MSSVKSHYINITKTYLWETGNEETRRMEIKQDLTSRGGSGVMVVLKLPVRLPQSTFLIRQLLSTSQVSTPHRLYEQLVVHDRQVGSSE